MQLSEAIKELIEDFHKFSNLEEISDWQGNNDFSGEKMNVCRNVTLWAHLNDLGDTETDFVTNLGLATGADLPWAEDHFQERVSGIPSNPGESYKYWPYHRNLDASKYKEEKFDHTYQERFWPKKVHDKVDMKDLSPEFDNMGIRFKYGDLNDVIELLKGNLKTRQAYLPIWFPEDTWAAGSGKRVPCTLGYYFYIEKGKLCCNYIIRSCDLLRHFRNDVYLTIRLQYHIFQQITKVQKELKLGYLNMYIFNLHLFENDKYYFNKKESNLNKRWKTE